VGTVLAAPLLQAEGGFFVLKNRTTKGTPLVIRNDVHPDGEAPLYIKAKLRRLGGKNPYGEDRFRLVLAQHCRHLQGGHWHEWDENLSRADRGGQYIEDDPGSDGFLVRVSEHKPTRIVTEMRWVKKYPSIEGWVLEEWRPAHLFGTPEAWAAFKVPGTELQRLGPYPSEGQYELAAPNAQAKLPTEDTLEEVIDYIFRKRERDAAIPKELRVQLRLEAMEKQAELREAAKHAEDSARVKDHMAPYWGSSREAGALRTQLADRAGLRSHVGN
jgi:hypothetical protein